MSNGISFFVEFIVKRLNDIRRNFYKFESAEVTIDPLDGFDAHFVVVHGKIFLNAFKPFLSKGGEGNFSIECICASGRVEFFNALFIQFGEFLCVNPFSGFHVVVFITVAPVTGFLTLT